MAEKIDEEGNMISPLGSFKQLLRIVPAVSVSLPIATLPSKMADKIDSEGNVISLKSAPAVSQPASMPAQTTRPVPAQTPHSSPPLATQGRKPSVNTTKLSGDRHVWKQRASLRERAAAPKTGGVKLPRSEPEMLRDKSEPEQLRVKSETKKPHVCALPGTKPCDTSPVRCSDKLDDHVPTNHLSSVAVTAVEKNDDASKNRSVIAPLASGWITLLAQLRSENIEQMLKLQNTIMEKDKQLASKVNEIKKLKSRMACLVHDDNLEHLERQQSSITNYMSSDTMSVTSQSSLSSYKESTCGSSYRQRKSVFARSVPGRRQPSSVPRYRTHRDADERQAMEISRRQQTDYISRISSNVDNLAQRYSPARYTHVSTKCNYPVEGGPSVLDVFPALCLFAGEEEPTAEELSKYGALLDSQLRPPPIYSPTLRKATVNWNKLNPFQHKNLPKPSLYPVHGCSEDQEFYEKTVPYRCGGGYNRTKLK